MITKKVYICTHLVTIIALILLMFRFTSSFMPIDVLIYIFIVPVIFLYLKDIRTHTSDLVTLIFPLIFMIIVWGANSYIFIQLLLDIEIVPFISTFLFSLFRIIVLLGTQYMVSSFNFKSRLIFHTLAQYLVSFILRYVIYSIELESFTFEIIYVELFSFIFTISYVYITLKLLQLKS